MSLLVISELRISDIKLFIASGPRVFTFIYWGFLLIYGEMSRDRKYGKWSDIPHKSIN